MNRGMNGAAALSGVFADWYWETDAGLPHHTLAPVRADNRPADDPTTISSTTAGHSSATRRSATSRSSAAPATETWCGLRSPVSRSSTQRANSGLPRCGRNVTKQKRAEQLLRLEHLRSPRSPRRPSVKEGLQAGLRAICDIEGWDYGRCFRVDAATGATTLEEGWFAREPATEQFLSRSRAAWHEEAGRCSQKSPRESHGEFGTFAFAVAQGRTVGLLAFSGQRATEPDERLMESAQALGSLFGQFLQRKQTEELLRASEARFRNLRIFRRTFSGR